MTPTNRGARIASIVAAAALALFSFGLLAAGGTLLWADGQKDEHGYLSSDPERFATTTRALTTDNLAREYFGDAGMLGYVKNVQREEIRQGIACVKHQNMAGSDIGDDHKEYFAGEAALKAGGAHNTMNQFAA